MKTKKQIAQILLECAQALLDEDEPKSKTKEGAVEEEKSPGTWSPSSKARGRIPRFVLKETGLKSKHQILMTYGPDAVFIEGGPLPKKIGEE